MTFSFSVFNYASRTVVLHARHFQSSTKYNVTHARRCVTLFFMLFIRVIWRDPGQQTDVLVFHWVRLSSARMRTMANHWFSSPDTYSSADKYLRPSLDRDLRQCQYLDALSAETSNENVVIVLSNCRLINAQIDTKIIIDTISLS